MKKPENNKKKRLAAAKRGLKRSLRLKKTQKLKSVRKEALRIEKKEKERKFQEAMQKLMQSRMNQQNTQSI